MQKNHAGDYDLETNTELSTRVIHHLSTTLPTVKSGGSMHVFSISGVSYPPKLASPTTILYKDI